MNILTLLKGVFPFEDMFVKIWNEVKLSKELLTFKVDRCVGVQAMLFWRI